MVGAHVSHRIDGVQPRCHDGHLNTELVCDGFPDGFWCSFVELRYQAEVKTLDYDPIWRKFMGVSVFLPEVVSERLMAPFEALLSLDNERIVFVV